MKIAFIGGGNMAAALIGGLIKRGVTPSDIRAIDPNEDARKRSEQQFDIGTSASVDASLQSFDAIVLAVKPQIVKDVAAALAPHLSASQLVISIVAGIRGADLGRWLGGHARLVRTMPNTPALIGMGVTGLVAMEGVDAAGRELASQVLGAVGQTVWFDGDAKIQRLVPLLPGERLVLGGTPELSQRRRRGRRATPSASRARSRGAGSPASPRRSA